MTSDVPSNCWRYCFEATPKDCAVSGASMDARRISISPPFWSVNRTESPSSTLALEKAKTSVTAWPSMVKSGAFEIPRMVGSRFCEVTCVKPYHSIKPTIRMVKSCFTAFAHSPRYIRIMEEIRIPWNLKMRSFCSDFLHAPASVNSSVAKVFRNRLLADFTDRLIADKLIFVKFEPTEVR